MKIFDAHMHFSELQAFYGAADDSKVDYSYDGYMKEREAAGIVGSICMGLAETERFAFPDYNAETPMLANLAENPPNLYTCLGINPHTLDGYALKRIQELINGNNRIVGFKIYAGYYHYHVYDQIYFPIYKIAADNGLTVAIHTGDTYSEQGLLEYSHPLPVDRIAVKFRDTKFLLCHMGDPWIMDACEVAYKNRNVFLDISGLLAGDDELVARTQERTQVMHHYSQGLVYLNNYKKAVFGTDWPIAPMGAYIDFCKKIIPEYAHEDVFYNNAFEIYSKLNGELKEL